jgi:hypothetical protein
LQRFNHSESFVRYIYRDRIGDNLEVGDDSEHFLSTGSHIWLIILKTFNIKIIGRYDKLFNDDSKKFQLVYKNIAFSSRFQFARIFAIERKEEVKGQIVVNVNSWLILKSRNQVMLPGEDSAMNIVNYHAIQTWVYEGETILEDLVMLFKFYQIWDTKCWYCPLEADITNNNNKFEMEFYNPYREIQRKKKHFWENEDEDDNDNNNNNGSSNNNNNIKDNNNNNNNCGCIGSGININKSRNINNNDNNNNNNCNNNNNISLGEKKIDEYKNNFNNKINNDFRDTPLIATYPTPHFIGESIKRSSDTVLLPIEHRVLSQERLQDENAFSSSFHLSFQLYLPDSVGLLKRQRDTTSFYEDKLDNENFLKQRKMDYNFNAPRYKPNIPRGDTQLVVEDEDEVVIGEDEKDKIVKEKDNVEEFNFNSFDSIENNNNNNQLDNIKQNNNNNLLKNTAIISTLIGNSKTVMIAANEFLDGD